MSCRSDLSQQQCRRCDLSPRCVAAICRIVCLGLKWTGWILVLSFFPNMAVTLDWQPPLLGEEAIPKWIGWILILSSFPNMTAALGGQPPLLGEEAIPKWTVWILVLSSYPNTATALGGQPLLLGEEPTPKWTGWLLVLSFPNMAAVLGGQRPLLAPISNGMILCLQNWDGILLDGLLFLRWGLII